MSERTNRPAAAIRFVYSCLPLRHLVSLPDLAVPVAMSSSVLQLQDRLQAASTDYQKLQNDLSVIVEARQRLDAQLQENELVKKVRALAHCVVAKHSS